MPKTKLRRLLDERGIKQNDLAEILGIVPQTMNRYVNGGRQMKRSVIVAISQYLNVLPQEIVDDIDWLPVIDPQLLTECLISASDQLMKDGVLPRMEMVAPMAIDLYHEKLIPSNKSEIENSG